MQILPGETPEGWEAAEFETFYEGSPWATGSAAFGTETTENVCALNNTTVGTPWDINSDILVRRTFELPAGATNIRVQTAIDNDIVGIWVNGTLVKGFTLHDGCPAREGPNSTGTFSVPASALNTEGTNVIAMRGLDRGVTSYLDLRVFAEVPEGLPATAEFSLSVVSPEGAVEPGATEVPTDDLPPAALTPAGGTVEQDERGRLDPVIEHRSGRRAGRDYLRVAPVFHSAFEHSAFVHPALVDSPLLDPAVEHPPF